MLYDFKAIDPGGRIIRGRQDAGNLAELDLRLRRRELDLIDGRPSRMDDSHGSRCLPRRELIDLCYHLEQLLQAGLPLLDGLADLAATLEHRRLRAVLLDLQAQIAGGNSLSQAMASQAEGFDPIFVSLVRAGESCGRLPEVLAMLGETLRWQDDLAGQTRKLLIYPSFVALVVLAATAFLMLYLVPQLQAFAQNMGRELPAHTRLLFACADLLAAHWPILLLLPPALLGLGTVILRTYPDARLHLDAFKLRLPVIGTILKKIALARFAATFAMLYRAGIPVLEAIDSTRQVVGNQLLARALGEADQAIRDGRPLATAFQDSGIFPPLVVRMLHLGERTGGLDKAMLNVSEFYTRDVRDAIGRLQVLIEPVLTISLGCLLAWVMLAMLGPIYDLIGQIP